MTRQTTRRQELRRAWWTPLALVVLVLLAPLAVLLGAWSVEGISQRHYPAMRGLPVVEVSSKAPESQEAAHSIRTTDGIEAILIQAITTAATGSQSQQISFGDETGQGVPDASFGLGIASTTPGIDTPAVPLSITFLAGSQATASGGLTPPGLGTASVPLTVIFLGNAGAVYRGQVSPQQPFLQGHVAGRVHLEGQSTSLGGYVAVGDEVHFLEADGRFSFPWKGGVKDIQIKAPGHLAVVVPQADVGPGQVLTVPELTLPFGDANGDGRIDVLDLSIAAANFGDTTHPLSLP